eukprot:8019553-Pyramimonas_sp.AAC.2
MVVESAAGPSRCVAATPAATEVQPAAGPIPEQPAPAVADRQQVDGRGWLLEQRRTSFECCQSRVAADIVSSSPSSSAPALPMSWPASAASMFLFP